MHLILEMIPKQKDVIQIKVCLTMSEYSVYGEGIPKEYVYLLWVR